MSSPTNHWKLGLFVIAGFCVALATILFFGARSLQSETVRYQSYFDESVQGLEVGSAVKFRGVAIGNVAAIDVASDGRHVAVSCELGVEDLNALGLSVEKSMGLATRMKIPPDLRVQLASAGITGVKFIQIDFFSAREYPPPKLPFPTPQNYLPAAPSLMKSVEDSVVKSVETFPELANQLLVVLTRIGDILGDIEQKQVPERTLATLAHLDQLLDQGSVALASLETGKLSRQTQHTLTQLDALLIQLGGPQGLLTNASKAAASLGSAAHNADHVGPALEETMRDLQGAAQAVQRLANSIERDPDILLKGRVKRGDQ